MTARPHPKQFALFSAKKRIADKIEALIALLDAIDGDTDLEDFLEGNEEQDLEFDYDTGACVGWPEYGSNPSLTFSSIRFAD